MTDSTADGDSGRGTPGPGSKSLPPSPGVTLRITPKTPKPSSRIVFVAPPPLTSAQKRQYKPAIESSLNSEMKNPRVNKIIGEATDDKTRYYFASYKGGIAYRFQANTFSEEYPELVEEYAENLQNKALPPFDPSASYVHPLSRMTSKPFPTDDFKFKIKVSRRPGGTEVNPYPEDRQKEEDEDEDYAEERLRTRTPPRTTRSSTKKELPFSPRKSHSQKVLLVTDSDRDWDSEIEEIPKRRRSLRAKKVTEIKINSGEDDSDYESHVVKSKLKIKPKKRTKSAQPMYGHISNINILDEDPFSDDEENQILRQHRMICEKCHQGPAHQLLAAYKKKPKGRKRKRSTDDEFEGSESETNFINFGGWVRCLRCPVAAHWKCLAHTQRDEVLTAVWQKDREEWQAKQVHGAPMPLKRSELDINETTEFLCGACLKGGICMGCQDVASAPDLTLSKVDTVLQVNQTLNEADDVLMEDGTSATAPVYSLARELLFRCFTCKRLAHYRHLPLPSDSKYASSVVNIAYHYQDVNKWLCSDCVSYTYPLEKIIAWRPYPANATEPERLPNEPPNYKSLLPREYLVKWTGRSYRRLNWVPHMWLVSTNPAKLKNFITSGTKVELLEHPVDSDSETNNIVSARLFEDETGERALSETPAVSAVSPLQDAEKRVPSAWKTIDRVLDILLWRPQSKKRKQRKNHITTSSEDDEEDPEIKNISRHVQAKGEQPPDSLTETLEEWEEHDVLRKSDIDKVAWAFIKWGELGYEEATWDSPPKSNDKRYKAFQVAFDRFVDSQSVVVPKKNKKYWDTFDNRTKDDYRKHMLKDPSSLDLDQASNLKLMPFQVDGFNWLCNNWWNHQQCILADEMGLGKTVQIVCFLGNIMKNWKAYPALVVVPNSTITNWVREFQIWAPNLRVVPFYGEKTARDVIKRFELFHRNTISENTKAKFHVLVTTYEVLTTGKDFTSIFKNQPRWEVLVVDEGQRLKNDASLLFRKLNELNSIHRVIMTGTPLNNNIRELLNLMNFLDPQEWKDLESLEKQHEDLNLNEELVKQLHNRLRPYFLRRVKAEVLDLPPKNEVIVPISMAPLQREVYRSILSHNINILNGLSQSTLAGVPKGRINNLLMQLRKCLQHPYIYAEDIEPRDLSPEETHEKLIDASGKLRFLKSMLPKLKTKGHRVLLFSQFVVALNVVEDFLKGEGYKFLRLDGSTKGSQRQKYMDEFNKPDSDYFIFLLTTRAGGVGINLSTADTVIIFDPDFNPHQDLQAIARAYRYGQKKTCLVFKLVVKDSAEERIIQIGKKKLALDHLIVQKMDDDDETGGEDVQSILTYGAQALFRSDQESRDIVYTDNDIEKLIHKTLKEAVKEAPTAGGGFAFSFAKVWTADKDGFEEVKEDDQTDSWAQALQKINEEREKEQAKEMAQSGRGARRKAADVAKTKIKEKQNGSGGFEDIPKRKGKKRAKDGKGSDGSAYSGSEISVSSDDDNIKDDDFRVDLNLDRNNKGKGREDAEPLDCGLCGQHHGPGQCLMMDRSENLAEYREMLILHADDEPWEERSAAVYAIDEILHKRGHLSLIAGQPLHPIPKGAQAPTTMQTIKERQINPDLNANNGATTSQARNAYQSPSQIQGTHSVQVRQQSVPNWQGLSHERISEASGSRTSASTSASRINPNTNTHRYTNAQTSAPTSGVSREHITNSYKKQKATTTASPLQCILCGQTPHLMKDCPVVRAGSKSIVDHITLLEAKKNPSHKTTIDILRNLLAKAKLQEIAAGDVAGQST